MIAVSLLGGLFPTFNVVVNCWVIPLVESKLRASDSEEPPSKLAVETVVVPEEIGCASARRTACVTEEIG